MNNFLITPKSVNKRNGKDPLYLNGEKKDTLKRTIGDFWQWAYSDLLQNTTRGVLAEYIVASLLGCDGEPRNPWDAYDLKTKDGTTIEIKTMSKLQAWAQKKLSEPRVNLSPTRKWNPLNGIMEDVPTFNADLYIFCYFKADNHETADPLDLSQWDFFVFTKEKLIEIIGSRKCVTLIHLEKAEILPVDALSLKNKVEALKVRE